jgi:two-component system, OmpR family, response regulator CpxR
MSVVALFSGAFCGADEIVERLAAHTGYVLCTDETIVARAATLSGVPANQLNRCFAAKQSVFNPFTRERERFLAWIKLALAEMCQETRWVLYGFSSHLIPAAIRHVLHVCLIADASHRIEKAAAGRPRDRSRAAERVNADDRQRTDWVRAIKAADDPWRTDLYDMVLPTHSLDTRQAVDLICKGMAAEAVQPTDLSRRAASDFLKAARIEAALAAMGHAVAVEASGDQVRLSIDRPVLMLDRLETELREALASMDVCENLTISVQPGANAAAYRRYSQEKPSKVLLVDDEREFVQTLSERLGMRDIGSAVAFDGESALAMIQEDEPEVMLLDLQMPGIDGMEVLKRVKADNPEIEVVILTGHGTDKHRAECLKLGAFAYLEKPVDIDVLGETLKRANEQMRRNRANSKNLLSKD